MNTNTIKILIVEDTYLIVERLNKGLKALDGAEIIGHTDNSMEAIDTYNELKPNIMILDNQSTVVVEVSFDGINAWKTFAVGQALVLDFASDEMLVAQGTQVYVKGTGGTGSFYVSLVYAG